MPGPAGVRGPQRAREAPTRSTTWASSSWNWCWPTWPAPRPSSNGGARRPNRTVRSRARWRRLTGPIAVLAGGTPLYRAGLDERGARSSCARFSC